MVMRAYNVTSLLCNQLLTLELPSCSWHMHHQQETNTFNILVVTLRDCNLCPNHG